ncbi:hypothetical protein [Actinokineospora sp. HUAS TT18]|uniref:hypothetical protein n=1 Tax=Actinokineospora sp. HUAS TT18 TaxID=3447451 RepID=UPI003F51EC18
MSDQEIKDLIAEVAGDGQVVLFAEKGFGLTGHLATALHGGDVQLITTMTPAQYAELETSALGQVFQPIRIGELPDDDAIEVAAVARPGLEEHHGVKITDPALAAAVRLARKHIRTSPLPGSAIDLLDETCSRFGGSDSRVVDADWVTSTMTAMKAELDEPAAARGTVELDDDPFAVTGVDIWTIC